MWIILELGAGEDCLLRRVC